MRASVRDYQSDDLAAVFDLWQRADSLPVGRDGLSADQAVELISSQAAVTLVAEAEGDVVGVVLGSAAGPIGWIHRLTLTSAPFSVTVVP